MRKKMIFCKYDLQDKGGEIVSHKKKNHEVRTGKRREMKAKKPRKKSRGK